MPVQVVNLLQDKEVGALAAPRSPGRYFPHVRGETDQR
jgi:hypothetical protein